jgi:PAS domain S-box-containing protein
VPSDSLTRRIEEACLRLLLAGRTEVTAGEVADEMEGEVDHRQVGRNLSLYGVHGDEFDRVQMTAVKDGYRRYRLAFEAGDAEALAVRESVHRETLFGHAPDPLMAVEFRDRAPIITAVNPAFESVFGFDAEDVVGRDSGEVVVAADRREEGRAYRDRVHDGERVETDVWRRTANGIQAFRLRVVPLDAGRPPSGAYAWYVPTERQTAAEPAE